MALRNRVTEVHSLPPARERNRDGVRQLDWNRSPEAGEALIDRMSIKVRATVEGDTNDSIRDYAALLNPGGGFGVLDGSRLLFGAGHWRGDKFVQPVVIGTSVSSGSLEIYKDRARPAAGINIKLTLNPTRTLAHLLARHRREDFRNLPSDHFFGLAPRVPAQSVTLDGGDNMLADFDQVGGPAYLARVRHFSSFFAEYEVALKRLIAAHLCPVEQGYAYDLDGGDFVAVSDRYRVRIQWGRVGLLQCEVYWERAHDSALAFVRRLANQALGAARTVTINTYGFVGRPSLEREGAATSVLLPLASQSPIALATYAKAQNRVRFEVRYLADMPQDVRDAAAGQTRLSGLIDAVRTDAVRRLPWRGLGLLMAEREVPDPLAVVDLAEGVRLATEGHAGLFRPVLESLVLTGGVTDGGERGAIPSSVVNALVRRGIVERVRLRRREDRVSGRRYRLTGRFDGVASPMTLGTTNN
jgi:hypothetical protein